MPTSRRPLVNVGGDPAEMPTGDTLDPSVLPASSSGAPYVPLTVAAGVVFPVPANTQVLYSEPIYVRLGGQISIASGGVLARVS